MSDNNDGGPAFPGRLPYQNSPNDGLAYFDGMSLRDYFAAKAMQGMLANANIDKNEVRDRAAIATYSYHYADAMLAAREVKS